MTNDITPSPIEWQLIAITPELGDTRFPINVSMSVGRQDSNDVVIALPKISRKHAKFNQIGKNLFIQDLGSSNGTFVNGERIGKQAVEIQPDDNIAFADLVFNVTKVVPTTASTITTKSPVITEIYAPQTVIESPSSPLPIAEPLPLTENLPESLPTPLIVESKAYSDTLQEASETQIHATQVMAPNLALSETITLSPTTLANNPTNVAPATNKPMRAPSTPNTESETSKSPLLWIIVLIIVIVAISGIIFKAL